MKYVMDIGLNELAAILALPEGLRIEAVRVEKSDDGTQYLQMQVSEPSYGEEGKRVVKTANFPMHQQMCGHWEICWPSLEMIKANIDGDIEETEEFDELSRMPGRTNA